MTLLEALKILREEGPLHPMAGLCGNTAELAYARDIVPAFDEDEMQELMSQWPKYSGDLIFPVPGLDGKTPKASYLYASEVEMWSSSHPYGALRLELLDWCIAELEKEAE